MTCVQLQRFVIALLMVNSIQGKKLCNFLDIECMTKVAHRVFKTVTAGIKTMDIESGDPLHQDTITGDMDSLKYTLTNVTLSGMSECSVAQLKCNIEQVSYEYQISCPHLIINTVYEAKGTLGPLEIDNKGEAVLTADDYLIKIKGKYGKFIPETEQKPHVFLEYNIDVDTEPNGKVTFKTVNLLSGDKQISGVANDYLNENWQKLEIYFRHVIKTFMVIHIQNMDKYLRSRPLEEIYVA